MPTVSRATQLASLGDRNLDGPIRLLSKAAPTFSTAWANGAPLEHNATPKGYCRTAPAVTKRFMRWKMPSPPLRAGIAASFFQQAWPLLPPLCLHA